MIYVVDKSPEGAGTGSRWPLQGLLAALVLTVAGLVSYSGGFSAPFVLDDKNRIADNPAIRQVWPPWGWLTYDRRPVAYLSFALNYAASGLDVWGYHVTNVAIHIAAALVLFGIARRTLFRDPLGRRYGDAAGMLALFIAMVWMVHPLQTQSVTYLVQRVESLMGLFFLTTLYCFIRAQDSPRHRWWYGVSVACCTLGVATKEVAAMAPLVVLWYDRAFVSRSWRELWTRRRWYYLGLSATWCLLAFLMVSRWETYGGKAGVVEGLSPLSYALSQPGVICRYLRLSIIPIGQCFDYAWPVARTAGQILPALLFVLALLGLTIWCVFKHPFWGFLGGWFFLILAPTSSIVPIVDLAFEHRMYLPLAAVVAAVVIGSYEATRRFLSTWSPLRTQVTWCVLLVAVTALLGWMTMKRNDLYLSEVALWQDVITKARHNARGHESLGLALLKAGRHQLGMHHLQRAVDLAPDAASGHYHLASILLVQQDFERANQHFRKSLELDPNSVVGHYNFAIGLYLQESKEQAVEEFQAVLRINPDHVAARCKLAVVLAEMDRLEAAIGQCRRALETDPRSAEAHAVLGDLLYRQDALDEAIEHFSQAVRIHPTFREAHHNLGVALRRQGRLKEARHHLEVARRLPPPQ